MSIIVTTFVQVVGSIILGVLVGVFVVWLAAWLAAWAYTKRRARQRQFRSVRENVHQVRLRQQAAAERGEGEPPTDRIQGLW